MRTRCIFQIQLLILANNNQLWKLDKVNKQLACEWGANKKNKAQLSVDLNWEVPSGTTTTTTTTTTIRAKPKRVYGLGHDDVTNEPKVVEEDLKDDDEGQTWTVTEVETKETDTFYTFSIENYFLTAGGKVLTVQGT